MATNKSVEFRPWAFSENAVETIAMVRAGERTGAAAGARHDQNGFGEMA